MMAAGAAIRQFFVLRHGYLLGRNGHPWPYAAVGAAVIVGVVVWLRPGLAVIPIATNSVAKESKNTGASGAIGYMTLQPILAQRCYSCHGEQMQMKNVRLDSREAVRQHAQALYQQAGLARTMPLNNATGISEAERSVIRAWFEGGAALD